MIDSAAQTHHIHSNQTVNHPFDLTTTTLEFDSTHVAPLLTDPIPFVPGSRHQLSAARQEYENPYMISPAFASSFQPTVNTNFLDCGSSRAHLPPSDNTPARLTCLESQSSLPVHEDWEDIWRHFIADPAQDQNIEPGTTGISSTIPADSNVLEFFNSFGFGDTSSTTHPSPEAVALLDDPAVHKSLSGILKEMEELIKNQSSCSNTGTEPSMSTFAGGLESLTPPSSTLPSTLPTISHTDVPQRPLRASSSTSKVTNERLFDQRRKNRRKSSLNANLEVFNSCKRRARTLRRQSSLSMSGAQSATPRPPAAAPSKMLCRPMMPTRVTPYNPLLARPLPSSMPNYPPIFTFFVAPSPSLAPFPIFPNNTYVSPAMPLTNVAATSGFAPSSSPKQNEPSTHTPASCIVLKDAEDNNIFKCSDKTCGKECKTRGDLKRHLMSRKHQLPLHRCHACGRVFQRKDPLRRHWRTRPQCSAAVALDGGGDDDDGLAGSYTDQHLNSFPSMDMFGMPTSVHALAPYQCIGVHQAS